MQNKAIDTVFIEVTKDNDNTCQSMHDHYTLCGLSLFIHLIVCRGLRTKLSILWIMDYDVMHALY